jgi:hypothetical protein
MSHIRLGLNDAVDSRPPAGKNNVWHSYQDSSRVLVFVHGLSDNSRDCWFNTDAGSYWPDRVRSTSEFHDYSVFLGGYETSKLGAGDYGIADCAAELFDSIRLGIEGRPAVTDHRSIVFVCHSMGGIVTRYMLESRHETFRDAAVGLVLIASPSTGSGWADAIRYIAEVVGNKQVLTLATNSELLDDLDRRFKALVHGDPEPPIRRLFGREACETKGYRRLVPVIVGAESAGRYFGPVKKLVHTDHGTCVKPDADSHPAHLFLRLFLKDFEKRFAKDLPPRRHVQLICERLRKSVSIETEDGDAIHQNGFIKIVGAPRGAYELRQVQQWSGFSSAPRLVRDSSEDTSPDVTLETSAAGTNELRFGEPPSPDRPVNAAYEYLTANAFSMHARELRLKTGRGDGVEFVSKRIDSEQVGELVIHVRLPAETMLSGRPYVRVVDPKTDKNDDAETSRTSHALDYSPLLRTISWIVPAPHADRSYRVCWRLAELADRPANLSDEAQIRHQTIVCKLVRLRDLIAKAAYTEAEKKAVERVREILATCGGVLTSIAGSTPPPDQLELSLMVLDDSEEDRAAQLRVVCSTSPRESWNEPMAVGDGNAGRAAKKEAVRIYDFERAEKAARFFNYKPKPGQKNHQWIVSIPLIEDRAVFGVFNLGTFDKRQVPELRKLQTGERLQQLTSHVQATIQSGLESIE